jgi:hypothetical protein
MAQQRNVPSVDPTSWAKQRELCEFFRSTFISPRPFMSSIQMFGQVFREGLVTVATFGGSSKQQLTATSNSNKH